MRAASHLPEALASAVARLLQPLVRILLSNGVAFDAFMELAKRAYADVALREFAIPGRKQTVSRVSVLTGLTRKEVQRLLRDGGARKAGIGERYNRAARVIAGWLRDPKFHNASGEPLVLSVEGGGKSFAALVRRYSGDMPARAVLDELLRVEAVQRLEGDRVRLVARAYVPRASAPDKVSILGDDVADLIRTIDHNLDYGSREPRFQRKVMYDNLPLEALKKFRDLSAERAQQLLERLDHWLARHDRDASPNVKGSGRARAGIGIYYFEESLQQGPEEKHHDR